jgi:hypothetical protein
MFDPKTADQLVSGFTKLVNDLGKAAEQWRNVANKHNETAQEAMTKYRNAVLEADKALAFKSKFEAAFTIEN